MADNCVSSDLALKVKHNALQALEERERNAPESSIELLCLISEPLMMELHYSIYAKVLCIHPLFAAACTSSPAAIGRVCHEAVSVYTVLNDDIVFRDLKAPRKPQMLFVMTGTLV